MLYLLRELTKHAFVQGPRREQFFFKRKSILSMIQEGVFWFNWMSVKHDVPSVWAWLKGSFTTITNPVLFSNCDLSWLMFLVQSTNHYVWTNSDVYVCVSVFVCPCQFVDRFQQRLKGRILMEPIRLVTFVETAVGLLNFKVSQA